MLLWKSLSCPLLVVAFLPITVAEAQNAQAQREPDVPFVPTTEKVVEAMLKLADVKNTDVVYDLAVGMAES